MSLVPIQGKHATKVAKRRATPAGVDVVRRTLQDYADRGVFKGFSERKGRTGATEFRFTWLTREPMVLEYDAKEERLTFRHLLPQVPRGSAIAAAVQELVESRSSKRIPEHRRLDPRRVRADGTQYGGRWSLRLQVAPRQHEYAVRKGVNLVNEVFTLLRASYPDYLWDVFGLPSE
jgi:hypothetical protein